MRGSVVVVPPPPARRAKIRAARQDREYQQFVDDLAGFLWHVRRATGLSFAELARRIGTCADTLHRLAGRRVTNPQMYTVWRLLRGCDAHGVLRHSQLERYRGLNKTELKKALAG